MQKSSLICEKCQSRAVVRLIIAGIFIFLFAAIVLVVYLTVKSKGEPDDVRILMLKQLLSHLQVLSMATQFPLQWPESVMELLQGFELVSASGRSVLALECELGHWSSFPSPVYAQTFTIAMIPLVALVIGWAICFSLYCCCRCTRSRKEAADRGKLMSVVLFFIVHIVLTKSAMSLFSCSQQFEGVNGRQHRFLLADARIDCYDSLHTSWTLGLALPMIIIYSLGIPLAAFVILRPIQRRGKLKQFRPVYGFLYSAYKDSSWYWEIVIVVRKVAFAATAVMLAPYGRSLQANTGMLIILISILAQVSLREDTCCHCCHCPLHSEWQAKLTSSCH